MIGQSRNISLLALVLVGIVAIVTATVAGYFYFQNQQLKQTQLQQVVSQLSPTAAPISAQIISPTPPTPSDETANWKTIIFSRYKFEMKLPEGWTVSNDALNGTPIKLTGQETIVDDYRNGLLIQKIGSSKDSIDFEMDQGIPKGITKYSDTPEINQILSTFKFR